MATLHLMVGLPCSGKTTVARQLEEQLPALRLTPDEWQLPLFGDDQDEGEGKHDARHSLIEAMLWGIGERALVLGINVILDFGFWAREEREDYRSRAARLGASSEVHFMDVPAAELLERNRKRNTDGSQGVFNIRENDLKKWILSFQAPDQDELVRRE